MAAGVGAPHDRAPDRRMSTSDSSRSKLSATDRAYRWTDQSDEPRLIPDSWAANGARMPVDDGEEQYFAVEVRTGVILEYSTDDHGEPTGLPNRERPGIRVLYVTADGGRAIVIESEGTGSPGTVSPRSDWAAVVARAPEQGDVVAAADRDAYRSLIRELYPEEVEG
jgi:hypothetical protein